MNQDQPAHWVDLHLHTNKSDGTCSVPEVLDLAVDKGLKTVAITDHDTVNGLEEELMEAQKRSLQVITGIEISAKCTHGTLHILGYGIDFKDPGFLNELERFQKVRKQRNVKIIEKLKSFGIDISLTKIMDENPGIQSLGRPHIATVLLEKGIVETMDEAFDEYLGKQGRAFISKEVVTSAEAITMIHRIGGLAFLAHPSTLNLSGKALSEYISERVSEGLDGIEVYSSAHNKEQIRNYLSIAHEQDLYISGGSDFHGKNKRDVKLGISNLEEMISADMVSEELLAMIDKSTDI